MTFLRLTLFECPRGRSDDHLPSLETLSRISVRPGWGEKFQEKQSPMWGQGMGYLSQLRMSPPNCYAEVLTPAWHLE